MSESSTEVADRPRVRLVDQETVTELLNGQIQVKNYPEDKLTILLVGNTGLKVYLDQKTDSSVKVHADFLPEDSAGPTAKMIKPSVIFGYALTKFYDFAKNPENFSNLGFDIHKMQSLAAPSNLLMINFMKRMLSRSGHGDLIDEDQDGRVLVDWQGILALEEVDPLIKFLRKMEKRGERTSVTYSKFA